SFEQSFRIGTFLGSGDRKLRIVAGNDAASAQSAGYGGALSWSSTSIVPKTARMKSIPQMLISRCGPSLGAAWVLGGAIIACRRLCFEILKRLKLTLVFPTFSCVAS